MIVTIARVTAGPDKREELVAVGQAVARDSRTEDGCISYRLYEDTETPNDFLFLEEWESAEALQRHFATPHVARFMAAIVGVIADAPDIKFHEIARTRDLAEMTGGR